MIIEKCSQIEFDLCIWTYLGRWGTDVICVSAEMRFCLNHYLVKNVSFLRSLPARGVWIEIYRLAAWSADWTGRSPQGECGLKFRWLAWLLVESASLPARGVWIEIFPSSSCQFQDKSLPARGVWIEIVRSHTACRPALSLPARGVWIEIIRNIWVMTCTVVAPRKGSVD